MAARTLDRAGAPARPLAIEPLVGWRVWRLHRAGGRLTLVSPTRNLRWPVRGAIEARCWIDHGHDGVPDRECRCGIYAANDPAGLVRARVASGQTCVVGTVDLWGAVVEHARGSRARFAYPSRLALMCGRCLTEGGGSGSASRARERDGVVTASCDVHAGAFLTSSPAADVRQELLATYAVDPLPIERARAALTPVRRPGPLRTVGRGIADRIFGGLSTWPRPL